MTDLATTQVSALELTELAAEIVAAYVAHNSIPVPELPSLLHSVYAALAQVKNGKVEPSTAPLELKPAVPIKKSVTDEYLICLEDGLKFKSLKRHLSASYGMSPDQYRAKWGLAKDYPMVAPAYASARSALAKSLGLGRKPTVTSVAKTAPKRPRQPKAAA